MTTRPRYALPVGFGALLVLLVIVTAVGLSRVDGINQRMQAIIYDQNLKTGLISVMLRITRERSQVIHTLFTSGDAFERDEAKQHYYTLVTEFNDSVQRLRELHLTPDEQSALAAMLSAANTTRVVRDEIVELLAADRVADAGQLLISRGISVQDAFHESLHVMLETKREATLREVGAASRATRNAFLVMTGFGVLVLLAGGLVAVLVTRKVVHAEDALQHEKELAQITLHSIGDGVITTDAAGRVDYLNPVAEQYTGWRTDEARGRPLSEVYRVIDERSGQPVASAPAGDVDGASGADAVSVRLVDRSGRECPIRYSQAPIRGRGAEMLGMIVVFHDISQIRAMAQQLIWQASHDALTGLVNRREFEHRLAELLGTAKGKSREHALMFMDLDNFKAVNDTCGHSAGDELLRQLTSVMMTRMRGSDTLARLGGDEFGALLESCPLDQALRIANAMRETIREFRFVWENKTFSVGVSIGLVPITAGSGNLNEVLKAADICCYEAKSKGRDRVQVYRPEEGELPGRHVELQVVSQINRAFELNQFRLFRQRMVPLNDASMREPHYEVLIRMLDKSGNLIPPTGFMPAAERYNLLTSIERWVISSLVEFLHREWTAGAIPRELGAGGERSYYAVNLSGASINDRSFPDFLRNLLTRYQLPPGLLCFEITETTAISNLNKAAELMREMKGMGCRLALDDFGTGMSSFAYLKHLPVDYLKIAGVFVKDMVVDPVDQAIVEAINRISHILGMRTIAESVEDARTLERITALGVDFAQGYFIAQPEALGQDGHTQPAVLQQA
ncbi:MAG: EAL domain-containing protein [Burkholderiales bacterium]|nr:EAL domain-containing protein [Burkholderiales bacterium]